MAYDDSTDSGAEPGMEASGPETNPEPNPEKMPTPEGEGDDTFFLPPDMLGGHKCEAGDVIKLEVVGTDKDGDVEVRMMDKEKYGEKRGQESWRSDLRKTMQAGPGTAPEAGAEMM